MSEGGSTDGLSKIRSVLGDLTNRPAKRGFSEISGVKSIVGCGKNLEGLNTDSQFAKQLRPEIERFIREKNRTGPEIDECEKGLSLPLDKRPCRSSSTSTETGSSQELTESLVSNVPGELKSGGCEVGDASMDGAGAGTWSDSWIEACRRRDEECRRASEAARSDLVVEPLVTVCKDGDEGLGVGSLLSRKPGSVEWSKLPKEGFQSRDLGRCINLKGDRCANSSVDDEDALRACSCPFCLKAAYIWSDLQYQDIKGRIAALKKSQKEAGALAQNSCKGTETNVDNQGNPIKSSKLESDLTGQWKSLFCHMENVLGDEGKQLQASFLMLKDLRENCKVDLENINGMPSHKL